MHRRHATVGGVGEVAVVVPLEVVDGVLVDEGHEAVAHLGVRRLVLQVQHLLRPPLQRQVVAAAQDALGMGPGGVGVDVDHLGLDPQAELHAEPAHVVDERVQALGPHVGVDGPVAEPGRVAAASAEPAVVEDEAVDPDRGGDVGQLR